MTRMECAHLDEQNSHYNRQDGVCYTCPKSFPVVLHDVNGCVRMDLKEFERCTELGQIKTSHAHNGDKINVKNGISKLPGYVKCPRALNCPKAKFRGLKPCKPR